MSSTYAYVTFATLLVIAFVPKRVRPVLAAVFVVASGLQVFLVDTPSIPVWVKGPIWAVVASAYAWKIWRDSWASTPPDVTDEV